MEVSPIPATTGSSSGASSSYSCLICTRQTCAPNEEILTKDDPKELLALFCDCAAIDLCDLNVSSTDGFNFCSTCSAYLKEWSVVQEDISKLMLRSNQMKATLLSRLLESGSHGGEDIKTLGEINGSNRKTELGSQLCTLISKRFNVKVRLRDVSQAKVHDSSKLWEPESPTDDEEIQDSARDYESAKGQFRNGIQFPLSRLQGLIEDYCVLDDGDKNEVEGYTLKSIENTEDCELAGQIAEPVSIWSDRAGLSSIKIRKGLHIKRKYRKPHGLFQPTNVKSWMFKGFRIIRRCGMYVCCKCQNPCGSHKGLVLQHINEEHLGLPKDDGIHINTVVTRVGEGRCLYKDKLPFTRNGKCGKEFTCGICFVKYSGDKGEKQMVQHMKSQHEALLKAPWYSPGPEFRRGLQKQSRKPQEPVELHETSVPVAPKSKNLHEISVPMTSEPKRSRRLPKHIDPAEFSVSITSAARRVVNKPVKSVDPDVTSVLASSEPKRPRGRPRQQPVDPNNMNSTVSKPKKRKRGRPRKHPVDASKPSAPVVASSEPKKKRGRPPKQPVDPNTITATPVASEPAPDNGTECPEDSHDWITKKPEVTDHPEPRTKDDPFVTAAVASIPDSIVSAQDSQVAVPIVTAAEQAEVPQESYHEPFIIKILK